MLEMRKVNIYKGFLIIFNIFGERCFAALPLDLR